MSDEKKSGMGLFINRKSGAGGQATPAVSATKPKDVKKRWTYVGIGVVGVIVVGSSLMGGTDQGKRAVAGPKKVEQMVSVTPPNVNKDEFTNQFANDLAGLRKEVQTLRSEKEAAAKTAEFAKSRDDAATKAGMPPVPPVGGGIVPPPIQGNSGGLGPLATSVVPPPVLPARLNPAAGGPIAPPLSLPPTGMPYRPGEGAAFSGSGNFSGSTDPMIFEAPGKTGGDALNSGLSGNRGKASVQYKKNPNAGLLPAGAFAPVSLLNGLDAGTSTTTQSNPMPVLMNITDQATLPGAAKYRIKSCFVLGTGYGDLSAERVYIRFSRMSCVDKSDKLVLSQEVAGYVVDSDGKLGMRGVVMDRQGAKLGKAMLAGFAQGLAGALGQAQSSTTSNLSTGATTSSLGGASALRASGLSGAQAATSQLADFYLKEAQSIFPVIAIDTGRTATIVFTSSVALNWTPSDGQYVQEIKPTN